MRRFQIRIIQSYEKTLKDLKKTNKQTTLLIFNKIKKLEGIDNPRRHDKSLS